MDRIGLWDGIATTSHTGEEALGAGRKAFPTTRINPPQTYQDERVKMTDGAGVPTASYPLGGTMADELRVMLEMGPKGKKVVAVALDWPGLARGEDRGGCDRTVTLLRSTLCTGGGAGRGG